ncbi:MAG: polysaccharide pyruvyl transferase family protein [Agathobacter sp.]|nr:polysaccharide pyruvyl transferase family protein [Agathobacter sp.]
MKKLIISTFNNSNNNYGALFQSCALATFLKKMGYDVYNVTIENRSTINDSTKIKIKKKIKRFLLLPKKQIMNERSKKLRKFAAENQKQLVYKNVQELYDNPPEADVYISGSDQVWNPVNLHDDFFLCYADDSKKKISYAASMGREKIPLSVEKKFADYIARYDCISVREDSMIPIIGRYTNKEIHQHIDPVFLMTKDEWTKLERPYRELKYDQFILVYALEWSESHNEKLLQLKKKTGLPAVSINTGNIKKIHADQVIYNASPNEFLYVLDKASYVVTTSFHGTAMSVVYNKKFMGFTGSDKPTRIESLFRHFEMDTRSTVDAAISEINYDVVNGIIEQDRKKAREYLLDSIEN